MQTQPRPHLSTGEAQRARQAAQVSDDTFKGGGRIGRPVASLLRSPWHVGSGQLWSGRGKRRPPQDD